MRTVVASAAIGPTFLRAVRRRGAVFLLPIIAERTVVAAFPAACGSGAIVAAISVKSAGTRGTGIATGSPIAIRGPRRTVVVRRTGGAVIAVVVKRRANRPTGNGFCACLTAFVAFLNKAYFARCQLAPLANGQIAQPNRPDARSHQAQNAVSYGVQHSANLPVAAFAQNQLHNKCARFFALADFSGLRGGGCAVIVRKH